MSKPGRIHLSGAGWSDDGSAVYGPFLAEAAQRSTRAEPQVVALLWADSQQDGVPWHRVYVDHFERIRGCHMRIVQLTPERPLAESDLVPADGIVVGGGVTLGYHAAIVPSADVVRSLIDQGVPYCGISAGAMIAGERALVGGFRVRGVDVAPEGSGGGLDELTIVPGLGLVDGPIDAHIAQNGNLGRLVAMVEAGMAARAVGVDENAALIVDGEHEHVVGYGRIWIAERGADGRVVVTSRIARQDDR